jgi:hypothetical protein
MRKNRVKLATITELIKMLREEGFKVSRPCGKSPSIMYEVMDPQDKQDRNGLMFYYPGGTVFSPQRTAIVMSSEDDRLAGFCKRYG